MIYAFHLLRKVRKLKCGSFFRYTCEKRESHTPKGDVVALGSL